MHAGSSRPATRSLGRHVFGFAAVVFGAVTLAWPDYYDRLRLEAVVSAGQSHVIDVVLSVAQLVGGLALQFDRAARAGAAVLCAAYALVTVTCLPLIFATPRAYEPYGNFFERFSLATGAAIVFGHLAAPVWSSGKLRASGRVSIGACAVSFAVGQATNHYATARLVPAWIPPDRGFWVDATTIAFALAAAALLTNRLPLLAARLLTVMLLAFGILVRLPILSAAVHDRVAWSETAETFAIAGAAWILADLLGDKEFGRNRRCY